MSNHPSTYKGDPTNTGGTHWEDGAALHHKDDGNGVLHETKALRRGTFAEIIRHLMLLPEKERSKYVIEKAGDREYSAAEAASLAKLADFPLGDE